VQPATADRGGRKMHGWEAMAGAVAVAVAVASLLMQLRRGTRRDADAIFAVVSGSLAMSLMAPWLGAAPAWMQWAVLVGASATCNGYWLLARALFRGEGGVGRVHIAVAAGVAALVVAYRGAMPWAGGAPSPWALALEALVTLASSTLLVLIFLEALRGWSPALPAAERRMRLVFMPLFSACVLPPTIMTGLARAWPAAGEARVGVVALCAMAMILVTHWALRHRLRMPLPSAARAARSGRAPLDADDARLARALRHQLEVLEVYREPELKVMELARRLDTPEHRLSRLIVRGLGEGNVNRMINRHRIAYAG